MTSTAFSLSAALCLALFGPGCLDVVRLESESVETSDEEPRYEVGKAVSIQVTGGGRSIHFGQEFGVDSPRTQLGLEFQKLSCLAVAPRAVECAVTVRGELRSSSDQFDFQGKAQLWNGDDRRTLACSGAPKSECRQAASLGLNVRLTDENRAGKFEIDVAADTHSSYLDQEMGASWVECGHRLRFTIASPDDQGKLTYPYHPRSMISDCANPIR